MREFINLIEMASKKIDWDAEWEAVDAEAKVLAKQRPAHPRPEDLALIDRARECIRHLEGEGGHCHSIAEWLENRYGWIARVGTYLAPNGQPACPTHFWNDLKDGTIVDSTPDQHGEDARSIRVIKPTDPEFQKYTLEWGDDWHPKHPDYVPDDWEKRDPSTYTGMSDDLLSDHIRSQHDWNRYWYTTPKQQKFVKAYQKKEKKYGSW